ncbi:MAG TPA: RDD family protein [Pyrinomonadaceae bacterium]|jgi:uncharacterized RDD family membrane protein YckC
MRCSACGARYQGRSARCPECGALQDENPIEISPKKAETVEAIEQIAAIPAGTVETSLPRAKAVELASETVASPLVTTRPLSKKPRSLLEFPGVNRSAMPQWRKELGERVREVQERRAREAILETAEIGPLFSDLDSNQSPVLELLPQAEMPPMNPLVVAALQRIERAHAQNGQNYSAATAVAYETQPEELDSEPERMEEPVPKPERIHTLAVVPAPESTVADQNDEAPKLATRKPKRVIDGLNDPALNYLDKIPRSMIIESCEYPSAGLFRRLLGGLMDLIVVGALAAPLLALTQLTNLAWENPRVIGFAVGTVLVIGFLYLTIAIAFTGRTLGMKLCSLRVVDARNGLIPTGSQAAGRSLLYLLSLAGAGVLLVYTLINTEHHTIHDHFTRTVVVRA